MFQSILLQSGLLGGLLTYYAKSQQFFSEIPPVFPDYFPDRTLINFFIFSWISLKFLIPISGKLTFLLSGLLTFYAQSKNFFPNIFPDFIPDRNLLNFFIVSWISFSFLRFVFEYCCYVSSNNSSNDSIDYPLNFNGNYDLLIARNHIAHRADSYNPYSRRYNPSSQYGSNRRTARWSHNRASRNNHIVKNNDYSYG
ncbi:hypothetical protein GLOIN_2v1650397 [Rhizophagus irregularis DAOM 181602=DAOM 197198]|uniref:Uncharacterized protein n=1 Tax=Rhizophagus irregularis (strain DAOM 181602 / DAOM 197198 / MUCL 43194) TaxID=747089 RepID=A0A2P4PNY3_RHIID|nr:hypothetical protein GLOIN_2v1650397 [Rhizophagus irregularis DAOM 181602=DAOM 197198]POG67108.1 hypothetical protein GLOIN_2v1650397 [Rhizophagus irregularis DAOM 181602=DAOM 197198]|eukprot:XP_025173974.1 hypothetical protein GLOIN_2v1650397 [Rhizophagus irregularis DAOM 181602=DAOM 197198]